MYDEMSRVMAAIHSVNLEAAGLADYGKPGDYFQRQFDRWSKQYRASEPETIDEMDTLMASLVHGDYRLDNVMFSRDNRRIIAVLDWELSTLGHPFADLAYQCMAMRLPATGDRNAMSGLGGVDVKALGIPTEDEYVSRYCDYMGIASVENWKSYLAFSFFRIAAIAQGVAKRAADGNASSPRAHQVGAMVRPLAQMALDTVS